MCGRYSLIHNYEFIEDRFEFDESDIREFSARYNIAPTQESIVIAADESGRRLKMMRWGLIPAWAKDETIGGRMINARAETLTGKRSFSNLLETKRCLVIADGFYEWHRDKRTKNTTPFRFTLEDGSPFAFAGLWDTWNNADGEPIFSYTIITTAANELTTAVHDRMPVILTLESERVWLDKNTTATQDLTPLLVPYDACAMKYYEVSPIVNSSSNDTPDCIQPAALLKTNCQAELHFDV